jgi:hypothetical protein
LNEAQRDILISYLRDSDVDIQSINFLKGGNISKDSLSIQYYRKSDKNGWLLCTDTIYPSAKIETRTVKAIR